MDHPDHGSTQAATHFSRPYFCWPHCLKEVIVQGRAFLILRTGVQGTRPDASEEAAACVDGPASKPRLSPIPGPFIVETAVPAPGWGGPLTLSISGNVACLWNCFPLKRKGSFFYLLGSEPFFKICFITQSCLLYVYNRLKQNKRMLVKG